MKGILANGVGSQLNSVYSSAQRLSEFPLPLLSATTKVALPTDHDLGREEVGFAGRADRCYVRWQIPKICGYHLSASIISLGANTSLRSP